MKKLYAIALAAVVALSANAEIASKGRIDFSKLGEIKTLDEALRQSATTIQSANPLGLQAIKDNAITLDAPAELTIETLTGSRWNAKYSGMLASNSGVHEGDAKFTYWSEYEELDLTLPDYSTDLYVGLVDGKLRIYSSVGYGQNSQGYDIKLEVINTSGVPTGTSVDLTYSPTTGAFTFPTGFAWALVAYNGTTRAGYIWAAYQFSLGFSDGDYALNIDLEDECSPENKFTFKVTAGADVASVKVLCFPTYTSIGTIQSSQFYAQAQEITSGTNYTVSPLSQWVISKSGYCGLYFWAYDADGNVKKTATRAVIVTVDNNEGWKKVADTEFVDPFFAQYYQNFNYSKTTVLEQNEENPALYRFVDPYADHKSAHSTDCTHYLYVNTADPEWIEIPFCTTGINPGGDGILCLGTAAALGYDKAGAQAKSMVSGTQNGYDLIFPAKSIFCHEQYYNTPGSWAYMTSAEAKISLPVNTLNVNVKNGADAVADAEVSVGDVKATTDAEGKAKLELPFSTGYFAKVELKATAGANAVTKEVALNGAANEAFVDFATEGVADIVVDGLAPAEYFTLQGQPVAAPAPGQLLIKRQGTTVTKILVK